MRTSFERCIASILFHPAHVHPAFIHSTCPCLCATVVIQLVICVHPHSCVAAVRFHFFCVCSSNLCSLHGLADQGEDTKSLSRFAFSLAMPRKQAKQAQAMKAMKATSNFRVLHISFSFGSRIASRQQPWRKFKKSNRTYIGYRFGFQMRHKFAENQGFACF